MNCSFLVELLQLLAKKLSRKQYAIKNECLKAVAQIQQHSKQVPQQLEDNEIDDAEGPYYENDAIRELDVDALHIDNCDDQVDFVRLPNEIVDMVVSIFIQINETPTDLGLKIYEITLYTIVLLMETKQLTQEQNLKYFSDFSDLDIASNVISKLSYYVEKHELMYAKSMIYTIGAAYAIECVDDIQFGYRTMNCILMRLFSHLFFVGESGVQFVTDIYVTAFFRKTFDKIYVYLLQNCQYKFVSPIVQNKNKIISKLCIDQEMEYIIFIVFQTICYYQFDFLYQTGKETNIESSFVEITTNLFSSFKDKPPYGERLVKLLQKQFDSISKVDSTNLHSVQYYTYILVIIGKIMQYSMEINSVDMYRIGLSLIKQVHYQIIQYGQLRAQFFILYDTFVLYVIRSSSKIQFKIDALMSIVTIFLTGNQTGVVDLYFTLYDLNNLPLITNILKLLIQLLNDQSNRIAQPINNFKRYKVYQLVEHYVYNKKIVYSGWVKEDIQLYNLQEMVLIVFVKLFRCYQSIDANVISYPIVQQHFEKQACIAYFNKSENPNKALNVFIKHGYCTTDRLSIINFVIENNSLLDKAQIGQLLGGNKPLNVSLLQAYTQYIFANAVPHYEDEASFFLISLRTFLNYFKTPGESQQIDRLLLQFSCAFAQHSSLAQKSAYILAYATMMLNTDMHNYSVKEKMTRAAFVNNTMRADTGFSQEFLGNLYDEISSNPLTLEEVELARSEAIYGEIGYYCWQLDKIQNILKRQLFIDEKVSVINVEENSTSFEDVVTDDGILACKTIYLNLPKTPRVDTSSGYIQRLIKYYNVKPVSIALLEYYSEEIFTGFSIYMDQNYIFRRFKFSNEIMFHLYRLAQISPDCQRLRSIIITKLVESFFCYARQSYPLSELVYQNSYFNQQAKQYTAIEDRNDVTMRIARSISEELTMAVLLLTVIDNNVFYTAIDLVLLAYFISMQNFNLVCALLGKPGSNIQIFSEQIDKNNLQAMFENDLIMLKYGNEFQKFFVTFPLFYPSLIAKTGQFLYLMNFDKCFSGLLFVAELMMLDYDLLSNVTERSFKSRLQQTFLFDFIAEFYVNYFIKFDHIFDRKTQLYSDFLEIRQRFLGLFDAKSMASYEISLRYFGAFLQHSGSAMILIRSYCKDSTLQINISKAIQSVILNFFSYHIKEDSTDVIYQVMYFLCHAQRGTIMPYAALVSIDTVTQLIPLIPISYQDIYQFILFCHASLHRIVAYNIKVEEYLSCAQCHHDKCEFLLVKSVIEDQKYPTVYFKSELAWQECYQQIVILISTMSNKIQYLKEKALIFIYNEVVLLKQFYESKIAQTILTSLNFALEYMCQQGQPEYVDALNLLSSEIVIPNLAQFHQISDNDAYNTLTQHFFKVLHTTDAQWYNPEVKKQFIESVFNQSIQPIILQHKQAKQYMLFYQLSGELLVVFSSKDAQNIESAKDLLHHAFKTFVLLFSQKFPSKTNFQKLLEVDFYNLLYCQMAFYDEYFDDIVEYMQSVFHLLMQQQSLINDQSDVFPVIFSNDLINLRQNYLYQAYESFVATLNKFPTISERVKMAFYKIVFDTIERLVQLANDASQHNVNISVLVDLFNLILAVINQNSIQQTQFNKDIGFDLTMQILKFCFIFANQQTSNYFLTMVYFTLYVTKRLIAEFGKNAKKCDLIHMFLIRSIRFNDNQVRENAIDCFEEYQSVVVEQRAERQSILSQTAQSIQVDEE